MRARRGDPPEAAPARDDRLARVDCTARDACVRQITIPEGGGGATLEAERGHPSVVNLTDHGKQLTAIKRPKTAYCKLSFNPRCAGSLATKEPGMTREPSSRMSPRGLGRADARREYRRNAVPSPRSGRSPRTAPPSRARCAGQDPPMLWPRSLSGCAADTWRPRAPRRAPPPRPPSRPLSRSVCKFGWGATSPGQTHNRTSPCPLELATPTRSALTPPPLPPAAA